MEHPYGVQPALGVFGDGSDEARSVRSRGLGTLAALPDEAILGMLGELPAADLARLATVSRFFYVFCNHDELWKGLCLEVRGGAKQQPKRLPCKGAAVNLPGTPSREQ